MAAPKQYGLILKKKPPSTSNQLSFAFKDESDDDEEGAGGQTNKLSATQARVKKQAKSQHEAALAEDPNIFDYDAAYDDMQQQKKEFQKAEKVKDKDRKPKYMEKLIRSAHKRNLDYAAREERKQQKERGEEGEAFADKEVFVTGAYRKQMEEVDKHRAEEARRDMMDDQMSVTKQKDMSGFYKHFLNDVLVRQPLSTTVKSEIKTEDGNVSEIQQPGSSCTESKTDDVKTERTSVDQDEVEHKPDKAVLDRQTRVKLKKEKKGDSKSYRRRGTESESDEGEQTSDDDQDEQTGSEDEAEQPAPKPVRASSPRGSGGRSSHVETKMEQQRRRFFTPERSPEPKANKDGDRSRRDRDGTVRTDRKEDDRRDRDRHHGRDRRDSRDNRDRHDDRRDRGDDRHRSRDHRDRQSDKDRRSDKDRHSSRSRRSPSPKRSRRDDQNRRDSKYKDDRSKKREVDAIEERLRKLKLIFKRRNDEEQIDEYRKRYFERRSQGLPEPPIVGAKA